MRYVRVLAVVVLVATVLAPGSARASIQSTGSWIIQGQPNRSAVVTVVERTRFSPPDSSGWTPYPLVSGGSYVGFVVQRLSDLALVQAQLRITRGAFASEGGSWTYAGDEPEFVLQPGIRYRVTLLGDVPSVIRLETASRHAANRTVAVTQAVDVRATASDLPPGPRTRRSFRLPLNDRGMKAASLGFAAVDEAVLTGQDIGPDVCLATAGRQCAAHPSAVFPGQDDGGVFGGSQYYIPRRAFQLLPKGPRELVVALEGKAVDVSVSSFAFVMA